MLYLYYGENDIENIKKARAFVKKIIGKKPDTHVFILDTDAFSQGEWEEKIVGQGLFEKEFVVYGNKVCEDETCKVFLAERIKDIKESKNIFILVERNLESKTRILFEKHSEEVFYNDEKKVKEDQPQYNLFALTDALGEKDRKKLWVLLQRAYISGASAEEIHSLFFWQIKNILIAKELGLPGAQKAESIGIKQYPFRKALTFSKNFSEEELKNLLGKLVHISQESISGGTELELGLEKVVLSV